MLTYLDSCIVIYWVEGPSPFDSRVRAHLASLQSAGHRFAVSDLTKLECFVKPFGISDGALTLDYQKMFMASNVIHVPLSNAAYLRAADIRGRFKYSTGKLYSFADALHLAAALENGCNRFLTNDVRLAGFPDIQVEVLP